MPSTFIQLENKVTCSLHLQLQAALQTGFSILGDKPCEIAFFFKYIPQLQLFFCSYSDLLCACQLFYSFFFLLFLRMLKAGPSPEKQIILKMGASTMSQRSPHVEQNEHHKQNAIQVSTLPYLKSQL